jgi:2,3-bisphosphoglycerate-dependent phosphoglycerate mutase
MRLLLLARHGQSQLNVRDLVNGDPGLDLGLSPLGLEQAIGLGRQLAAVSIDLCVTSRFPRARETARLALADRADGVQHLVEPDLDDIRIGELEGKTLADYRAWKHAHKPSDPFPGGESLLDAARRYATAFDRLVDRAEATVLCVCHEIPVRYAVNAASGSHELDGPVHDIANAAPYVFDEHGLRRAAARLRALAG